MVLYSGEQLPYQVINYAMSDDDLLVTWEKHPGNPVIARPPRGFTLVSGFRDPFVWREGERFYMLVGSGIAGAGGTAFLYRSDDLVDWEYGGRPRRRCRGERSHVGNAAVLSLGEKHVLLVNVWPTNRDVFYWVGTWEDERFVPETFGRLDYGGHYLSPSVLVEEDGRALLFGFIKESNGGEAQLANGWSGGHGASKDRLSAGGRLLLGLQPAEEVASLRGAHRRVSDIIIPAAASQVLEGFQGTQYEVIATFDPQDADWVGLRLRRSTDGSGLMREETLLYYDALRKRIELDRRRSTLLPTAERDVVWAPFELEPGEALTLRVFVDHSVVEVFVNDHLALTTRIYPVRENSVVLDVFAQGGEARLLSLDLWEIESIWSEEHFGVFIP